MIALVVPKSIFLFLAAGLLLLLGGDQQHAVHVHAMKDKATGITFAPRKRSLEVFGVGVRRKGPIKVYAVGMYCTSALKEALGAISRKDEKAALECLRSGAHADAAFALQMTFKVGAEKFSAAIADSVAPRYKGSKDDVEKLKALVLDGVSAKGGASKGLTLDFGCTSSGVHVSVDGKDQGTVHSSGLSKAFCDVYLDDKCVSPSLRSSVLDNCCAK